MSYAEFITKWGLAAHGTTHRLRLRVCISLKMVMFSLFVFLQLKEFENQNRNTCSSDTAEWTGPSSPTPSELLNNNNTVSLPPTLRFLLGAGKKKAPGRSSDAAPVPPLNRGPLQSPAAQDPSPSCRATGPLLFMTVKALTLHCDALSGWIQLRPLLCRQQLFCCACGVIREGGGGSGSGHIFQICLDRAWMFRSAVCVLCLSKSYSFLPLRSCGQHTCKCWTRLSIGVLKAYF